MTASAHDTAPLALVEHHGPAVSVVTLNRPDKRNAISTALVDAVCGAIAQIEADPKRRVLILRGAGPVFCAGLDLKQALERDKAEQTAQQISRLFRTVSQSRLVTLAAVHGAVMAGGAGLMGACDMVVAAEGTIIGYPEIHRGLVPAILMTFMVRQLTDRHVRELLILGENIDARRAYEIGLVNRVVPPAKVLDEVLAMAKQVLKGGPKTIDMTKHLLEEMSVRHVVEDQQNALKSHMAARRSEEALEGLAAFVEKRPPKWQVE